MVTGYDACCLYRAIKLHFNTEYDYFKYSGKIKYTPSQFQTNKHRFTYEKLAKKFSDDDLKNFYIANFINNENVWIHELLQQDANDVFIQFVKRKQSLSYMFENDLMNIFDTHDPKRLFKSNSKEFPVLLTKLLQNEICIETVIIMNRFLKFIHNWDETIKDDIVWPHVRRVLLKYEPFIEYDKIKFKETLKKRIEEFK